MTARFYVAVTFLAALGSGVIAGGLFAFSTFVMKALAQLPPAQGIAAMQSINVVILRSLFIPVMMGTAALCLLLGVSSVLRWRDAGSACLLAGSLFYLCGAVLVTMVFNVPLNNALAIVPPDSTAGVGLWVRFVGDWTAWNHVRSAGAILAAAACIIALVRLQAVPL